MDNPYKKACFLKSAAKVSQLPEDIGIEVAFAGRSNAGKSSALNTLTANKQLARTSKTPGRTQLINLFELDEQRRLVDLPGYGYAKVSQSIKEEWQRHLSEYLHKRQCLQGLVLLMDCRHPLKELDQMMIGWCINRGLPVHILLSKSDKISKSDLNNVMALIKKHYQSYTNLITVQGFSSLKKTGLETLIQHLNQWYQSSDNVND